MGMLDQCRDLYGPLPDHRRALIHRFLANPGPDTWDQARQVIIARRPVLTLGMAVRAVTRGDGVAAPDPFTLYRAIKYALGPWRNTPAMLLGTDHQGQ